MSWMDHVQKPPLDWLLEPEDPSVRAFTLTELLDRDRLDADVVKSQQMIVDSPTAARLLAGQHPDGHWGAPEHYFGAYTGTEWRWLLLQELGCDPYHPQMMRAARFLMDIAYSERDGTFVSHLGSIPVPCYTGWLLWGLLRSGFGDDPRVQSALRWVADTMRFDDGDGPSGDLKSVCS